MDETCKGRETQIKPSVTTPSECVDYMELMFSEIAEETGTCYLSFYLGSRL